MKIQISKDTVCMWLVCATLFLKFSFFQVFIHENLVLPYIIFSFPKWLTPKLTSCSMVIFLWLMSSVGGKDVCIFTDLLVLFLYKYVVKRRDGFYWHTFHQTFTGRIVGHCTVLWIKNTTDMQKISWSVFSLPPLHPTFFFSIPVLVTRCSQILLRVMKSH